VRKRNPDFLSFPTRRKRREREGEEKMSGVTGQPQEEDKKPNDQSAHINLKVKGQVSFCDWLML
jgi:hypothetical protein